MSRPNTIMNLMGQLVIQENGCAIWPGRLKKGYAEVSYQSKKRKLHRLLYEYFVGTVPEGMVLDHLCRNRACGNFAHLEPVTVGVNVLRGESFSAVNKQKATCLRGHVLEGENIRISKDGKRICRPCMRDHGKKHRNKKKAIATSG